MPTEMAQALAEQMAIIPFFPSTAGALAALADEIACICETAEQGAWLVRRMRRLYAKWPGPAEMRLVFCGKFQPLDGIQAHCDSEVYPDGIPGEAEAITALPSAPQKRLAAPKPEELTAARSLQEVISAMGEAMDMNRPKRRVKVPEVPVVSITDRNRITEADFERIRQDLRSARAAAECGL